MPNKSLMYSTLAPGTHFGGASQTNYTTLWGQPSWPNEGPNWIGWSNVEEGEGGAIQLDTRVTFTGEVSALSNETMQRIVCFYVLAHMPDQSIGKACEALTEIYQWSREVEHAKVSALEPHKLGRAKVRESQRGEFVVRSE